MAPPTAIALVTRGGKLSREAIPVPTPGEHQVLVKISHVAQNPTDSKPNPLSISVPRKYRVLNHPLVQSLDADAFGDDAVLGCDFVGTVELTGDKVSRIKAGTVIAGLIWGGQSPSGTKLIPFSI
jgi:NADPH:quinone reductase-like Zn-dependent oxidoreductase